MNSIIALVYLSVAVILIVFGVKQIKNRKNLRKINQKQEDEVKEKIKIGILSADTVYRSAEGFEKSSCSKSYLLCHNANINISGNKTWNIAFNSLCCNKYDTRI